MNIGIDARYIQDHFPGIGRYTFNLTRALAEVAPQQHFVVFHNPALPNTRFDLAVLAAYPNLKLISLSIPTFSLAEQVHLSRVVRTSHAHHPSNTENLQSPISLFHSPYFIKPYFGLPCPSVVTIYDVISARYPEYLPSGRARLVFEITTRLALATSAHVFTLSEASRRDLITLYHVPPAKITVTPLAADDRFQPQPAEAVAAIRHKYGLSQDYVLYLGINKPHKNLKRLLAAWRLCHREHLTGQVPLVIGGAWDPRYSRLKQTVDEFELGEVVHFLGPVPEEDLPALYTGATLFVFPSLYEGFGLPVLEAMACGTPVACSGTSSLPEVAGDAAFFFDPTDVEAIAVTLTRALAEPDLRIALREQGLARARQFSWQQTAQKTMEAYTRLA